MSEPKAVSNAFVKVLSDIRQGSLVTELTVAMQNCVHAAKDLQKPAKLKLTLTFTPQGNAMVVSDDAETKLPQQKSPGSVFFPTDADTLTRENPEQRELELRTVSAPETEIKEVLAKASPIVAVAQNQ
jgi:hypothetical protein